MSATKVTAFAYLYRRRDPERVVHSGVYVWTSKSIREGGDRYGYSVLFSLSQEKREVAPKVRGDIRNVETR